MSCSKYTKTLTQRGFSLRGFDRAKFIKRQFTFRAPMWRHLLRLLVRFMYSTRSL